MKTEWQLGWQEENLECCQNSTKKVFQDGLGNNIPLRQFPIMLNK